MKFNFEFYNIINSVNYERRSFVKLMKILKKANTTLHVWAMKYYRRS